MESTVVTENADADGQDELVFSVTVEDEHGNALEGVPVEADHDEADITFTGDGATVTTGSDGKATFTVTSTTPQSVQLSFTEQHRNNVASATGSFIVGPPDSISVSPSTDTSYGDGTDEVEFEVLVVDGGANPVENANVDVTHDGADITFTGDGETSQTNAAGKATFTAATTMAPQTVEFTFTEREQNNVDSATGVFERRPASTEATAVTRTATADGVDELVFEVSVVDTEGRPVGDVGVEATHNGTAIEFTGDGDTVQTNSSGYAIFTATSTTAPQSVAFTFTEREQEQSGSATGSLEAGAPASISVQPITGTAFGDGSDELEFEILVEDAEDNPVGNIEVEPAHDGTDITFTGDDTVWKTDSTGKTTFTVTATTAPQTVEFVFTEGEQNNVDSATGVFERRPASVEATAVTQTATADGADELVFEVSVVDAEERPVEGVAVEAAHGGADVTFSGDGAIATTDSTGKVTFTATATTAPQTVEFTFTEQALGQSGSATGTFESGTPAAVSVTPITDAADIYGSNELEFEALVEDAEANPVENATVHAIHNGTAIEFTGEGDTAQTNSEGYVTFTATSPTTQTDVDFTFTEQSESSYATTTGTFEIQPADVIVTIVNDTATADGADELVFEVSVVDAVGDGVSDITVKTADDGVDIAYGSDNEQETDESGTVIVTATSTTAQTVTFTVTEQYQDNEATVAGAFEAGVATSVLVETQPDYSVAGELISGPPAATAVDIEGNPVEGVEVAVEEAGGYEFDGGDETQITGSDGVATFDNLVIDEADLNYQLAFSIDEADDNVDFRDTIQSTRFTVSGQIDIEDWYDLNNVRDSPGEEFVLIADLNETTPGYDQHVAEPSGGFEPIDNFEGTFDGGGHVIEGLYIDRSRTSSSSDGADAALFTRIADGATVTRVGIVDAVVRAGDGGAGDPGGAGGAGGDAGGLAVTNEGTITETFVTSSTITAGDGGDGGDGDPYDGGFGGNGGHAAGVVASNEGTITDSYVTDVVITAGGGGNGGDGGYDYEDMYGGDGGSGGDGGHAGGLIGSNQGNAEHTYAAAGSTPVAGAKGSGGRGYYWNGYDGVAGNGGGLVGENTGEVSASYFDNEPDNGVGEQLATAEMQDSSSPDHMHGFDFDETWEVTDAYPQLTWNPPVEALDAADTTETAGIRGEITVTARTEDTNVVEGVVIELIANGSLSNLDVGETATTNADGTATFTFEETNVSVYGLEFALVEDTSVSDTATVTIEAGAADSIQIKRQPGETQTAGNALSGAPAALITDEFDNPVHDIEVTVEAIEGDGDLTEGSTTTIETDSEGVATFNNLVIETADEYRLEFAINDTDENVASADEAQTVQFDVEAAVPDQVNINADPGTATAGDSFSLTINAADRFGNPVEDVAVTVTTNGTFTDGTFTRSTDVSGLAEFDDLVIEEAGTYELEFGADGVSTNTTSDSFAIEPADAGSLTVSNVTATAGESGILEATVTDLFGNHVANETIAVADDNGLSGLTASTQTDDGGEATFTFEESSAGEYSIVFELLDDSTVTDTATVAVETQPTSPSPPRTSSSGDEPTLEIRNGPSGEPDYSRSHVIVTGATGGESVRVDGVTTGTGQPFTSLENIAIDGIVIEMATDRDFSLNVSTYERDSEVDLDPDTIDSIARFETETGSSAAGYVQLEHDLEPDDISNATFDFTIQKSYLDELGVTPEQVNLYRFADDEWGVLPTTFVSEDDTHTHFEATSPGFSTFGIGTDTARFEGTSWELESTAIELGEAISLTATVENHGRADGVYVAALTANGDEVASDMLPIAAGESSSVPLEFTPSDAGEYELVFDGMELGTVTVSGDTTPQTDDDEETVEEDTSGSWFIPIFGFITLLAAIAGGAVVIRTRFDDSG